MPLYVVHITCKAALDRVRDAHATGARVWGETCSSPKTTWTARVRGAKWVCSPPLREPDDQAALWAGLTDQCPFTFAKQKMVGRDNFA